jgi:polysaccharide deacetylase 2 family uncharacterized protein YibQ
MFAKRPTAEMAIAGSTGRGDGIAARIGGRPILGVAGAAALFLIAVLVVIVVAGDPRAGMPSVRIPLSQPGAPPPPPGWREALAPDQAGDAPVSLADLQLLPGAAGDSQGQAVITLPDAGGQAGAATGRAGQSLPSAPIAGLTAPGPGGALLPIISSDGRSPSQAYARPFVSNGRPKVALVIGGLGLNAKTTRQAIEQLPPEVTLSFVPYSDGLQGWIDLARANGHEVLLEAPMEPKDYPDNDPGPYTLMANGKPQEITERLEWLLSRATGYFGLTNYLGSKFVANDAAMTTFSGDLRARGLAFIDDGSAVRRGGGLPRASADMVIDDELAGDAIDKQLLLLEATATRNGQAMGSGFAYPLTLDQVSHWATSLAQRGFQLAPVSAVMVERR